MGVRSPISKGKGISSVVVFFHKEVEWCGRGTSILGRWHLAESYNFDRRLSKKKAEGLWWFFVFVFYNNY